MCFSVQGYIKFSLRSGGWDGDSGLEVVEARNQLYISLAPRFLTFARDDTKVER